MDSLTITAITVFCTVLGTWIAWKTFQNKEIKEPNEEKQLLLEKFDFLDELNHQMCNDLSQYATKYNCFDHIIMRGITFRQSLNLLYEVRDKIITKQNRESMTKAKSSVRVKDLTEQIKMQIKHHSEAHNYFKMYIKPYSPDA